MNEFRRAEKKAFAVGLAITLSVNVIMNVLHFVGLVWLFIWLNKMKKIKDKGNIISAVDFLTLKIERSMTDLGQEISKDKRTELFKYQDRLVDFLMKETEKVRQSKDLEQIENALSKLKFLRREATSEG